MTDDLTALRRIAEAATPGPWRNDGQLDPHIVYDDDWSIAEATRYDHDQPLGASRGPGYIDPLANAAHIAAFNPATALRLLARLERAEADAARLREVVRYPVESVEWAHPSNGLEEGTTRIIIQGVVQPVGAGDTIAYFAAALRGAE